jgi:hypothetical protein
MRDPFHSYVVLLTDLIVAATRGIVFQFGGREPVV